MNYYLRGFNDDESLFFSQMYLWWLSNILLIFSWITLELSLAKFSARTDLSFVLPLGSPMSAVAPPIYKRIKGYRG